MIDAWLNPVFQRLPGRVSRSLCASLSHMKLTKAGEWGSELFGRVPDRSHWHICMWNRHFTPPHFLIVAKIICEIAFHQECFPRQLSHNLHAVGPTELTHAPLLFLPLVRFYFVKKKRKKKKRNFLNTHLSAIILEGYSTCCLQQQVEPNVIIARKVRGSI